jgi:hypothetical protein
VGCGQCAGKSNYNYNYNCSLLYYRFVSLSLSHPRSVLSYLLWTVGEEPGGGAVTGLARWMDGWQLGLVCLALISERTLYYAVQYSAAKHWWLMLED